MRPLQQVEIGIAAHVLIGFRKKQAFRVRGWRSECRHDRLVLDVREGLKQHRIVCQGGFELSERPALDYGETVGDHPAAGQQFQQVGRAQARRQRILARPDGGRVQPQKQAPAPIHLRQAAILQDSQHRADRHAALHHDRLGRSDAERLVCKVTVPGMQPERRGTCDHGQRQHQRQGPAHETFRISASHPCNSRVTGPMG